MIRTLRGVHDWFFGQGAYGVTVPPMDGPFRPNTLLDLAEGAKQEGEPDNLLRCGDRLFFSVGHVLYERTGAQSRAEVARFPSGVLALACDGHERVAVALASEGIRVGAPDRLMDVSAVSVGRTDCVTALSFGPQGDLLVAVGSDENSSLDWARDLLERGASGSLWSVSSDGVAQPLRTGLAWPAGVVIDTQGRVVYSEAWRHRLVRYTQNSGDAVVLDALPAYPGRLVREGASFWLCLFAPRRQLIEFVLREEAYRLSMLQDVEPEYWIAPKLRARGGYLEPLQWGEVKQLGIAKPWAPSLSYGLLARLDEAFVPRGSYHSRADGVRHGVCSVAVVGNQIHATSRGSMELLTLDI